MSLLEVEREVHALGLGTPTRVRRAVIRQDVKRGATTAAELLREPPECMRGMPLFDVVTMAPGVGQAKLEQLAWEAMRERISLVITLGRASARTREWLAGRLG